MAKTRRDVAGYGRALELWEPPADAGEPMVCVATTFTFDPDVFEVDCLGRFLQMDTHPSESEAVAYLIEREEKLASTRVCVLVDRRHAREKDSLRWDVLPVVVEGAVQHAKLSLLLWARHLRVTIGSGNLTEPGYRRNLEVFGCLDLSLAGGGPKDEISSCLDFLSKVADRAMADERRGPKKRVREAIDIAKRWVRRASDVRPRVLVPQPVFGGIGPSIIAQLRDAWTGPGAIRMACVTSPFFDADERGRVVAEELVSLLAQTGTRTVCFDAVADALPDGRTRVQMPRGIVSAAQERCDDVAVYPVSLEQQGAEVDDLERRPLHAKLISLSNKEATLLMMGSSNFTRAGLGVSKRTNIEANLVYRCRSSQPEWRSLEHVCPQVDDDPIPLEDEGVLWDPISEAEGEEFDQPLLPAGFREAIYEAGAAPSLRLSLGPDLPGTWEVRTSAGRQILSSQTWDGSAESIAIPWTEPPVLVLVVTWEDLAGPYVASWPVNVEDPGQLPPPEELKNLSLEDLVAILGSAGPLHRAVARILTKRQKKRNLDIELDPHKRVNTEEFLLRRTKRVALALDRLRERLERPVLSREALTWRLRGPVGPQALADAFCREARQPAEAMFYLAELALTLRRLDPTKAAAGGLDLTVIRKDLREMIHELQARSGRLDVNVAVGMRTYVSAAFEACQ